MKFRRGRRIFLSRERNILIDDPHNPADPGHQKMLNDARALPGAVAELLREPREEFDAALDAFEHETARAGLAEETTLLRLAHSYHRAADWFERQKAATVIEDHTDQFLAVEFLGRMARGFGTTAEAIATAAAEPSGVVSNEARPPALRSPFAHLPRRVDELRTGSDSHRFRTMRTRR